METQCRSPLLRTLRWVTSLLIVSTLVASVSAAEPQPCGGSAFSRVGNKFYVQGGATSGDNLLQGMWALDLTTSFSTSRPLWTALALGPPNAYHSAGYSGDNSSFITFGRDTAADPQVVPPYWLNTYNIATDAWSYSTPASLQDDSRRDFSAVTNPTDNKVYVLGGNAGPSGSISSNRFNVYDTTTHTLTESGTPSPGPQNISTYAAVWVSHLRAMLVIGGHIEGGSPPQGLSMYRPDTGAWSSQVSSGPFVHSRISHCAASSPDGYIVAVYGGFVTTPGGGDPYVYILDTRTWTWTSTSYPGRGRGNAACTIVDDTFVIWGGFYNFPNTANGVPMGAEALLLFSISSKTWLTTYTPSAALAGNPGGNGGNGGNGGQGGNGGSGGANGDGSKGSMSAGVIGGIAAGVAAVVLVAALTLLERRRRKNKVVKTPPEISESGAASGYPRPGYPGLLGPPPRPPHPSVPDSNGRYQALHLTPSPEADHRPSVEGYHSSNSLGGNSDPSTPTTLQFLNTSEHGNAADLHFGTGTGALLPFPSRQSYQSGTSANSGYYPPPPVSLQQSAIQEEGGRMYSQQHGAFGGTPPGRRPNDPQLFGGDPPTSEGYHGGAGGDPGRSDYYHDGFASGTMSHPSTGGFSSSGQSHSSFQSQTPLQYHSQYQSSSLQPPSVPNHKRPVSGPQGGVVFGVEEPPVPGAPQALGRQPTFPPSQYHG